MLRPATPLSVLLFAAFVLILLSVLSTPIISAIPLGSWLKESTLASLGFAPRMAVPQLRLATMSVSVDPIRYSHLSTQDLSTYPGPLHAEGFSLNASTRSTLSSLLIVHPVAGLLTLIMFVLAVIAHFHSPSHSPRYLLVLFIVGILNFLVCLLSFLVDVLLFVPHIAWGSYVVLAATILVALSGLVSCAMRRTVVGRKARQKRIAENAEMSGENYYNRQAQVATAPVPSSSVLHPTVPLVSGANGRGGDALPEFASYEKKDDQSSDERIPLTAARSRSSRSPGTFNTDQSTYVNDSANQAEMTTLRSTSTTPGARDQYGNPLLPQDGYPMRSGSVERMGSPPRGPLPPGAYRGRGGYPGPGRGGYNGYGPPPGGRGGYGPPGRGGYGPPGGRGGYGPPPRGYGGPMRGGRTPPPPSYQGQYDRRGSPAGTNQYGSRRPSPGPPSAPAQRVLPQGFGQFNIRDSDSDVAGMLALQQARTSGADRHMSDTSRYSQEENAALCTAEAGMEPRRQEFSSRSFAAKHTPPSRTCIARKPPRPPPPAASAGSRSPAESERSTFTSISQRGINPRWNPPVPPPPAPGSYGVGVGGGGGGNPMVPRRPVNRTDILLSSNPDFELPSRGAGPSRS
ncbi:hypothetical protein CHGG_06552 [Chaetomium globosum CBS 148.51]|uniref:PH-response regulator protein palI/RIM9 n=1 Tax=Chaetomium globosum (strain ATCC 6205 / CBS 148.51 / DSM 1962 / NBRC 6347 / NRRL 1970) TaxID=306901 RepID=Q2H463_CHAGB|nr:uncharacterized protein CHGG_06552 [Chaetomium globosum CBS 148.51]EAQ89933.1 hypothetical protein CHGG_06552 [Chaetomium globosum CBS 148.51]